MTGLGSSCGACKFLRRRCMMKECVFAPYFSYDQAATHFAAVHKVFGASNVSKLLLHLPVNYRGDAAVTIAYEARARMGDPIYGCVSYIIALQHQVSSLQQEIEILSHQMGLNSVIGVAGSSSSLHASSSASNCETQLSPHPNAINTQCQQNHENIMAGNQDFDSKMIPELATVYGWENHNPFCNSPPCSLDDLLKGVDIELFPCWPDSSNNGN
ncbi:unnamed protein product [Linum tenue]|uniref:LOB domain-containing protein n=2 Tax=Linum tenue TaxID=586396 RepID=A0AAV0JPP5_9ROSI|nr:unnamed protein product [Linum tenue]CAI0412062.1 unnamed protein product [Linum tenue]